MGQAHCSVCNQTERPLCVITFNMADLIYKSYHTMYIINPGETQLCEANPDAIGLKLGIIFETRREKQEFYFHRFTCNNDSVLTIVSMEGQEIDHFGEGTQLNSKHKLREMDVDPFNMAAECLMEQTASKKAPTRVEQFVHKVVDTSEVIAHKVVNTIEHPVETFKGRGGGSTNTAPESDSSSVMNEGSVSGSVQQNQNTIASKFTNFTNSIMNKEKAPAAAAKQVPPTPPPPPEEDPEVVARRFEMEVRRAQNEQRWEAELARIKLDRELAEAEAMRREMEERELEEQRQLEAREAEEARLREEMNGGGRGKKRGTSKGGHNDGPEVVGSGGCKCVIS